MCREAWRSCARDRHRHRGPGSTPGVTRSDGLAPPRPGHSRTPVSSALSARTSPGLVRVRIRIRVGARVGPRLTQLASGVPGPVTQFVAQLAYLNREVAQPLAKPGVV